MALCKFFYGHINLACMKMNISFLYDTVYSRRTHQASCTLTFGCGRGDEDEHAKLIMWILKPMKRSEIDGEIKPEQKWMLSITIALDKWSNSEGLRDYIIKLKIREFIVRWFIIRPLNIWIYVMEQLWIFRGSHARLWIQVMLQCMLREHLLRCFKEVFLERNFFIEWISNKFDWR